MALAWVRQQEAVTAPIVRPQLHHLDDAVASLDVELTADELEALGADYAPRANEGF